jgi:anti-sigma regulatory factor (Ser/Thr protein kinase)
MRSVLADGGRVVDGAGRSVGRIVHVLLDVRTVEPAHATVACVLCDEVAVVPLARAWSVDGCLHVPYTAADVCGAPRADGSAGPIDPQLAEELERYYLRLDDGAAVAPDGSGPWPPVSTSAAGPQWWQRRQWRWPSVPTAVGAMRRELRPLLDLTSLCGDQLEDLVLAAAEAATNAIEHTVLPTLPFFDVLAEVGEDWATIVVQDHGGWRTAGPAGDRGRGLLMISRLADATLTVGPRGTTVVLRNRPGSS